MWQPPSLTLRWGPYTRPDPQEQQQLVTAVVAAINGGLMTRRMGVEKLAADGVVVIENVGAVVEELEAQAAKLAASEPEAEPVSDPKEEPADG